MTTDMRYRITVNLMAIAITFTVATAQPALADAIVLPPMPSDIQVPAGNTAFLKGQAVGTQNYVCLPSGPGYAWTFMGPQATLFVTIRWIQGDIRQQIMTHFLSPNPSESGMPRATWQSSLDTSSVWGRAVVTSIDPNFVAPGAIPWLRLEVVGARRGPAGGSLLTPATFIQRLNTSGGVAPPPAGCSQSTHVGGTVMAPYTADYFFYRASR